MRPHHVVEPLRCMDQAIVASAKHIDNAVPQPAYFCVWEADPELLFDHPGCDSKVFVSLRQVANIDRQGPLRRASDKPQSSSH